MTMREPREVLSRRSAGVLLHITALPGDYGIGDLGPEAYAFVDMLVEAKQRYWQILPLNPVTADKGFSPYSSSCSMACYPMLISPALLVQAGYLSAAAVAACRLPVSAQVDFLVAAEVKDLLLRTAFRQFLEDQRAVFGFESFIQREAYWLKDYAVYEVLTQQLGGGWQTWDRPFREREEQALNTFARQHRDDIVYSQWLQYTAWMQWQALKSYANRRGVQLIGDLPFYVSYDAADVWNHRHHFAVDAQGILTAAAGVPPDYFNAAGQHWGMPVYHWESFQQTGDTWWTHRIRKNLALYDVVRLDHFRAFSAYWEIPAEETTAVRGAWKPGPGDAFFRHVQQQLGLAALPFIAEDLGDIDDDVYTLRDRFQLPGMTVLQFAFGGNMSQSPYIPHHHRENTIVYTGTHDNNTTRGWYRQDATPEERLHLQAYVGHALTEEQVSEQLCRTAYQSVGRVAILPAQDLLNLDESARFNAPATAGRHWRWRMTPQQMSQFPTERLKHWATLYDRLPQDETLHP